METGANQEQALDLVWGAAAIGKLIRRTRRATYHMLENGELPARKVNGQWVCERGKLINFFTEVAA